MKFKLSLGDSYKEIKKFLEFRVNSKEYRGFHWFQHNRITAEKVKRLIDSFLEVGCDFIEVPRGDEKNNKKGFQLSNYPEFEKFVSFFHKKEGQGTANTIKKNMLPDLSRIGIFNRHDKNFEKINPFSKKTIWYLSLNKEYDKYYKNTILLKQLINDKILLLFNDWIKLIFDILMKLKTLNINEFMLFISWYEKEYYYEKMNFDSILKLIKEYRTLSKAQEEQINIEIKEFANPKAEWQKNIPKNKKRDYSNWKNESQEFFQILKEFSLFHLNELGDTISLSALKDGNGNIKKYKRSLEAKKEYFKKHKIIKKDTFELDHIIPFSLIKDYESYMKIDNWLNMIYIDANTHRKKTNNKNKYMFIKKESDFLLEMHAYDGEFLTLENNKNMLINTNKINNIVEYNDILKKKYNI